MRNDKLPSLVFMFGRIMREGFHKNAKPVRCSLLHFQTLRYVKKHDRPLIREVAEYLLITPPAATLLVEGLVKEGLLERVRDARDGRAIRLVLTQRGKRVLLEGVKNATRHIASVFSVLTPRERKTFALMLGKVVKRASA